MRMTATRLDCGLKNAFVPYDTRSFRRHFIHQGLTTRRSPRCDGSNRHGEGRGGGAMGLLLAVLHLLLVHVDVSDLQVKGSSSPTRPTKYSVATAHDQLVSAGVRDAGRAATTLRQVEAAYAAAVSTRASPRPKKALAEQLQQLQQAVRADLESLEHKNSEALQAAVVAYDRLGATATNSGVRRAALLRVADLYSFFGNWEGAWQALAMWTGDGLPDGATPADYSTLPTAGAQDRQAMNALAAVHLELADQPDVTANNTGKHTSAARMLLEQIVESAPNDLAALVRLAFLHARPRGNETNFPLAAKLLEQARAVATELEEGGAGAGLLQDQRFWQELGGAYARMGQRDQMDAVFEEAAQRGVFPSQYQRPREMMPGLAARPFWEVSQLPSPVAAGVAALQRSWRAVREEGLALMTAGAFAAEPERLTDEGWDQLILYDHGRWNQELCGGPAASTCTVLSGLRRTSSNEQHPYIDISGRGQVKFSLLQPGTKILPHTGTTNARLRLHLGLRVPGIDSEVHETREQPFRIRAADKAPRGWANGQVVILDDSFEHELIASPSAVVAANDTCANPAEETEATAGRLILIVDMDHPDLAR